MDLDPSLNCSNYPKIWAVSFLNLLYRSFKAWLLFNFFFVKIPGSSPNICSIWEKSPFAGPELFLKWLTTLILEKWLRHTILFFCNYWANTLVNIDLLNGKKSFLILFFFLLKVYYLLVECFLNFLRISSRVLMLLSAYLDRGILMNENVFCVLKVNLFTSLNCTTIRSSLSSVSLYYEVALESSKASCCWANFKACFWWRILFFRLA